jgi:hypothetical protein
MSSCDAGWCQRVKATEPQLPINPSFVPSWLNPCIDRGAGAAPQCLPFVHVISGWHMFSEEALGWLKKMKQIEPKSGGGCFDDWSGDEGAAKWVSSFGRPPASDAVILTHCNKLLSWYPAFAGRYTNSWGKAYGPCKEREFDKPGDYYQQRMWPICRPQALAAHDAAMGTGGAGHEATPPFVMKALYGKRVRLIAALRNPVDRLELSFWDHRHYPGHYGASPAGLHKYIKEQSEAFNDCIAAFDVRRCAYLFEFLGPKYGEVFFHCDQLIRGLYEPFVRDWHAAFDQESLHVTKVEDLLDAPAASRRRLLDFLGLPGAPSSLAGSVGPMPALGYAALHAQTLRAAKAQPMNASTRELAENFYRPHNKAMCNLVGWSRADCWQDSAIVSAADLAAAPVASPPGPATR